jgi:hypothetical protein
MTYNHDVLRKIGLQYLYEVKHCRYLALELKLGRYVYDLVGSDGRRIYIVEAKQSINDYKKDCHTKKELHENIERLKEELNHTGNTDLLDDIKKEKKKSCKFSDQGIFKLCTECFIIAPDGLIKEPPTGWGLLNEDRICIVKPESRATNRIYTFKIIREIAKKHTKLFMQNIGITFEKRKIQFPDWILK